MDLAQELAGVVRGDVVADTVSLAHYQQDASLFAMQPRVAVAPRDTRDLQRLVHWVATQNNPAIALTPWSAGTDMSGGPLSRSIIVDMSRHFNHVLDVTEGQAVTQPGVPYRDFEAATLRDGWLMPAYPASRETCTVGGMVANNAGGERSLQYGKVERYVEQLKVILRDGNEYTFQALASGELDHQKALPGLEGEIYRRVFDLVTANQDAISAARPQVTKSSAGYNLWDVYPAGLFNLIPLFVGSQGTLGIITEITFRLIRPQPHRQLLVIALPSVAQLAAVITTVRRYAPESFEAYDSHTLALGFRHFPRVVKNISRLRLLPLAFVFGRQWVHFTLGRKPALVLLAEFAGAAAREVRLRTEAAQVALRSFQATTKIVHSDAEAATYWAIRRESFNLLRSHGSGQRIAPFIEDICVPPLQLPAFLPKLAAIMAKYEMVYTIAGHVGDGNFHIMPLMDLTNPASFDVMKKLGDEVYQLVFEHAGSISGEHNDGLIRGHYLKRMFGAEIYHLFEEVKGIFDPQGIFNPGKKIGVTWAGAKKYLNLHKAGYVK